MIRAYRRSCAIGDPTGLGRHGRLCKYTNTVGRATGNSGSEGKASIGTDEEAVAAVIVQYETGTGETCDRAANIVVVVLTIAVPVVASISSVVFWVVSVSESLMIIGKSSPVLSTTVDAKTLSNPIPLASKGLVTKWTFCLADMICVPRLNVTN